MGQRRKLPKPRKIDKILDQGMKRVERMMADKCRLINPDDMLEVVQCIYMQPLVFPDDKIIEVSRCRWDRYGQPIMFYVVYMLDKKVRFELIDLDETQDPEGTELYYGHTIAGKTRRDAVMIQKTE